MGWISSFVPKLFKKTIPRSLFTVKCLLAELVHPFLKQLQKVNRQRYKDFDDEDMNNYIEVKCFENIQYLHLCKMML